MAKRRNPDDTLVHPSGGRLYWLPTETIPPPVEMLGEDAGTCHHIIPAVPKGSRRCFCACVRLPPESWPVRVVAVRPPYVKAPRGDWGFDSEWKAADAIVIHIEAPDGALAILNTDFPRVAWDDWACVALNLGPPDDAGLWAWSGTLTVGWSDDDHDFAGDSLDIELTWVGEWSEVDWAAICRAAP